MSLLDAEQTERYVESLKASVQALEADLAATQAKLREAEAELTTVREVLNVDLKIASDRVLTLELESQQAQARIADLEAKLREATDPDKLRLAADTLPRRDVPELIEALRIRALALTGEAWERTATREMMKEAAEQLEQAQARIAALKKERPDPLNTLRAAHAELLNGSCPCRYCEVGPDGRFTYSAQAGVRGREEER